MKFISSVGAVLLSFKTFVSAIELKANDEASIKSVTSKYAYGLMSYYKANASNLPKEEIGIFPEPHYWWEAGAAWGGMIEYSQFTGDKSYIKTLQQALVSNYGPNNDVLLPWKKAQEGNDDQAFWCLAVMSALEYRFPEPDQAPATYLDVAQNCFNNIVSRWDEGSCGGGLKWQIYPENSYGYNYKNSISNGATFALGARLARYTGNQTYADWAVKLYDWTKKVGLIGDKFEVFDGSDDKTNCAKVADETEWTYNNAMFLHGSAFMYDFTNGDDLWKKRTTGFLDAAGKFFKPYDNATDIMYEAACETGETGRKCNLDQQSFKAYLARFMAKTAMLAPFTEGKVTNYLKVSASAAAQSCGDGTSCGSKWYTGGFDGQTGVGQQLSALEVTQALLMLKQGAIPSKNGEQSEPKPSSATGSPTSTPEASSALSSTVAHSSKVTPTHAPSNAPSGIYTPSPAESTAAPNTPSASSSLSIALSPGASSVPAPSTPSPSNATSPGKPDGQLGDSVPTSAGGVCTCTPTSTTTIYVPPVPQTSALVIPSSPPTVPTTIVPVTPPANTTSPQSPPEFTGAAVNVKMTCSSILGMAAMAVVAGLL